MLTKSSLLLNFNSDIRLQNNQYKFYLLTIGAKNDLY